MTESPSNLPESDKPLTNNRQLMVPMIVLIVLVGLTSILTMRLVNSYGVLTRWVYDYSATLTQEELATLASMCNELSSGSSSKMAIVILATTDGAPVNLVADGYFKDLGVGSKDLESGILLLYVLDSTSWQVRTSEDLAEIFPPERIQSIMIEHAGEEFDDNIHGQGIINSAETFIEILERETS